MSVLDSAIFIGNSEEASPTLVNLDADAVRDTLVGDGICHSNSQREREKERERERETERQRDRETDRERQTETDRQIDRKAERETDREKENG